MPQRDRFRGLLAAVHNESRIAGVSACVAAQTDQLMEMGA
jgi:hypothetical protein